MGDTGQRLVPLVSEYPPAPQGHGATGGQGEDTHHEGEAQAGGGATRAVHDVGALVAKHHLLRLRPAMVMGRGEVSHALLRLDGASAIRRRSRRAHRVDMEQPFDRRCIALLATQLRQQQ